MSRSTSPTCTSRSAISTALQAALEKDWGWKDLRSDLRVIRKLQKALRKGDWKVTVRRPPADSAAPASRRSGPASTNAAYGLAVDIGSTTIAMHLCSLLSGEVVASSGAMNPQIRFGEDLMSRVSYVMMNPGGAKR